MAAITPARPGIWTWLGKDPDHGFEIIGHVVTYGSGLAAIDPPDTPGGADEVRALGDVRLVAITGPGHVRGGPKLARALDVPLVAPPCARSELAEAGAAADAEVHDGDAREGWQVLGMRVEEDGKVWEEVAYYAAGQRLLVVGDLLSVEDGQLIVQPPKYYGIAPRHFAPVVRRLASLQVDTLCTAHSGVCSEDVGPRLRSLAAQLEAE
ncbi:MAG TPA: hypothetical protein VF234_01540 [Limnochordia bacterium]